MVPAQGSYNWKLLLWVKGVETTKLLLLTLLEKTMYRGEVRFNKDLRINKDEGCADHIIENIVNINTFLALNRKECFYTS